MPNKIAAIDTTGQTVQDQDMSSGLIDVKFFRPDGVLLYSFSKNEVLSPEWEMPIVPSWTIYWDTYTGTKEIHMDAQCWNYTQAQVIQTVQKYGKCDIGALYVPKDGKTHIRIEIADDALLSQPFRFGQTVANGVRVDWGDGSTPQTYSSTTMSTKNHVYPGKGVYDLTVEVLNGKLNLSGEDGTNSIFGSQTNSNTQPSGVYRGRYVQILLGGGITSIGTNTFRLCHLLNMISIPKEITSIGSQAFRQCNSLECIILPYGITSLSANFFANCFSLISVSIPMSVTTLGTDVFSGCYSVKRLIIPMNVTAIGARSFYTCYTLATLMLPDNYGNIGVSMFYNCYALQSIKISENATQIGNNAFDTCHVLSLIEFPPNLSSIGTNAFYKCYGVIKYDFSKCTKIPTITSTNVFTDLAQSSYILVPDALYGQWRTANIWSSSSIASHIVPESSTEGMIWAGDGDL